MAQMPDVNFIFDCLVFRAFSLAMCLDAASSVLLPIGNKNILATINTLKGNEKEHCEIKMAIYAIGWRYLPVLLFLTVSVLQMNLSLDLSDTRLAHLFLTIWALVYNRNSPGFNIFNLGSFLNMLVCYANKGMMPTIYSPSDDGRHILMTDSTRLNFLSDWIFISPSMISIGDVLIAVGAMIFALHQIRIFVRILRNRAATQAVKK